MGKNTGIKQQAQEGAPEPGQWQAYFKSPPNHSAMRTARVMFPLSLFMIYHTGESFQAIISTVLNTSGLSPENVEFILGDEIQANNFAINRPDTDPDSKELRNEATAAGNKWLEENNAAVEQLKQAGVKFTRWSTIYNEPKYQEMKHRVFSFYYEDDSPSAQEFKQAIQDTAYQVLDRFKERGEISDLERGKQMAVRFVLEECALFAYKARNDRFHYMAYPSDCPAAVTATKTHFVDPFSHAKNLLKWLRIGLKHPRVTKPQSNTFGITILDKQSTSTNGSDSSQATSSNSNGPLKVKLTEAQINSIKKSDEYREINRTGSADSSSNSSDAGSSDDEAETKLKKIFRRVILTIATATADSLEVTGQLPKEQRTKVLSEVLGELYEEMSQGEPGQNNKHSPPLSKRNGFQPQ